MDGIHYTPNLEPRSGTMLAQNQTRQGQNGRTDQGTSITDPAFMNLINVGNTNGMDQPSGAGTSSAFNQEVNVAAFVVLAAVISKMFGIEMDTGGQRLGMDSIQIQPSAQEPLTDTSIALGGPGRRQ